ncbi:MAG: HAD family hydrolase [Chloroflexi bacterium]|nr:HAD family hydrolase [Chloroflexota bacterium]
MADQLRAVLFDMDDTLIDWSGVQVDWTQIDRSYLPNVIDWLQQEGIASSISLDKLGTAFSSRHRAAWQEAGKTLVAPHMPQTLIHALAALGVDCTVIDEADLIAAYDWRGVPGCRVFPDVPPALEILTNAGILLGIVTNASQPMFMRDAELVQHGLLAHFPVCRIAAVDTGRIKPHPHIFESALAKLGTEPAETVFVGDNFHADIEGALGVGMRAMHRDNSGPCLRIEDNWAQLHTLQDLPTILDAWYPGWRNGTG